MKKPFRRLARRPVKLASDQLPFSASTDADSLPAGKCRTVARVEREVNAAAPRLVAEGIRIVRAQAVSGRELTLVYSLVSLRVAEIEAELWEKRIRPMIVHNVRRAEAEESRGLFEDEVTVNYLYVDDDGKLIVQVNVTPTSLPGIRNTPSGSDN